MSKLSKQVCGHNQPGHSVHPQKHVAAMKKGGKVKSMDNCGCAPKMATGGQTKHKTKGC